MRQLQVDPNPVIYSSGFFELRRVYKYPVDNLEIFCNYRIESIQFDLCLSYNFPIWDYTKDDNQDLHILQSYLVA